MQAAIDPQTPVDSVVGLSHAALSVLVSWLFGLTGGSNLQDAKIAGVSKTSYYRAVRELDHWLPDWRDYEVASGESHLSPNRVPSESHQSQPSPIRVPNESHLSPIPLRGSLTAEVLHAPTRLDAPVEDDPVTTRQRAMRADLMDGSGDWKRGTDPCNVKRRAQIEVLQDAWREMFPGKGDLVSANAKAFLVASDNCCEDVLDAMQQAAGRNIEYPLGYIKKVLANTRLVEPAPIAAAVSIGTYKPQPVDDGGLMEPSEAYKKRNAWIRSLPDEEASEWEV